ncbi:MAG: NAD(P)-dependent dehydrogenase, short-chain alcohol dehydrogenase family [Solirubrobacterales bacterium]|jgi:NAD(P)-dependent dehydrogenase (short-subunit alcohol dehydrogenase family)|nr:NAD(P)-dependent dehydrogenase, short-chain alcohol dehydrogenase family [Solirubrobacterales bacterium]
MQHALQDKVAIVTGGTTGIGLAIAKRFAAEGAHVFVTGRRQAELDAAVAEAGERAVGVRADSSRLVDLDALYARVAREHSTIDIVVANAGGGNGAPLEAITEEQFDTTFATNVKGVLFTVQKALPLLADNASVILTGSTTSAKGLPNASIYAATKAAVRNFARSWIVELTGRGVRINVLSPGPTRTPGLLGMAPREHEQALLDGLASTVPLGRIAEPDEIAKAAVFLASDDSSFVNGIEFFVDGGQAQI